MKELNYPIKTEFAIGTAAAILGTHLAKKAAISAGTSLATNLIHKTGIPDKISDAASDAYLDMEERLAKRKNAQSHPKLKSSQMVNHCNNFEDDFRAGGGQSYTGSGGASNTFGARNIYNKLHDTVHSVGYDMGDENDGFIKGLYRDAKNHVILGAQQSGKDMGKSIGLGTALGVAGNVTNQTMNKIAMKRAQRAQRSNMSLNYPRFSDEVALPDFPDDIQSFRPATLNYCDDFCGDQSVVDIDPHMSRRNFAHGNRYFQEKKAEQVGNQSPNSKSSVNLPAKVNEASQRAKDDKKYRDNYGQTISQNKQDALKERLISERENRKKTGLNSFLNSEPSTTSEYTSESSNTPVEVKSNNNTKNSSSNIAPSIKISSAWKHMPGGKKLAIAAGVAGAGALAYGIHKRNKKKKEEEKEEYSTLPSKKQFSMTKERVAQLLKEVDNLTDQLTKLDVNDEVSLKRSEELSDIITKKSKELTNGVNSLMHSDKSDNKNNTQAKPSSVSVTNTSSNFYTKPKSAHPNIRPTMPIKNNGLTNKQKVLVGAGIGAAALATHMYRKHKRKKEEEKRNKEYSTLPEKD